MNLIYIEISFDNIYNFAIGKVKCYGNDVFSLVVAPSLNITNIEFGVKNGRILTSITDKGRNILQFNCVGLVSQRNFIKRVKDTDLDSYGMQYYPFVSSEITLKFNSPTALIQAISIAIPEAYRVLWFKQNVTRNGEKAGILHSQGENESVYVFTWKENSNKGTSSEINAVIPIRLGGREYLRVLTFPYWYFLLSLTGLAALSMQDKFNVTYSGVAAAWLLMLRHFTKSNAPQLNTLLRDLYVILGLFMLVWATCWQLFGFRGLALVVPVLITTVYFNKISTKFKFEGVLTPNLEKFIFYFRYRNEQRSKSINL